MVTNAVKMLILCALAFVPLLLGEVAGKRSAATTEDFILQNRQLKIFPMYATVFSTWMSSFVFMGAISYIYTNGPVFMTTVGWDALFAILFVILGKRIWHYGKTYKYMTPVDFFNDIYDSKVLNIIITTILIVCTMLYLQVQIVGGVMVMNIASGDTLPWYTGGIIFFSVIGIYLWAGGLRAVAWTDIFYGILIIASIIASGFFLMNIAGGKENVFRELISIDPANVSITGENKYENIAAWLCLFVITPVGAFMGPQIWIRNYAASSEKNFNILPLLLCISSIIWVGSIFAGSAGILLSGDVKNPDEILIRLIIEYANPYFYTFVLAGIFATIFSTANSQVHALASVLAIDVYKRYINDKASDRKVLHIAKWMILIISAISFLLIMIVPQSIFDLGVIALGGTAQLIIPVLGAMFWKRSSAKAAVFGLIVGEVAFFAGVFYGAFEASVCGVIGLFANAGVFAMISAVGKSRITVSKKITAYKSEYHSREY